MYAYYLYVCNDFVRTTDFNISEYQGMECVSKMYSQYVVIIFA